MDTVKRLPDLCDDQICTGCSACVNACAKGALTIIHNNEGFYRPQINADICINCGLCEKSCPVINPPKRQNDNEVRVYGCWHKDDNIRVNSSSGGAFTALAQSILSEGGIIVGAAYGEKLSIEHILVKNEGELERLRLSKYAQSNIGDSFKQIKNLLEEGRKVLFCGTPCQCAGLRSYLRIDYDNLYVTDFICHGVPSIYFLQKYINWLEEKYGEIKHINFRNKQKGWYDNLRVITDNNNKNISLKGSADAFWVGFNNNNCLQYSCYNCKFQGFSRYSDLTLSDFWGIGKRIPFVPKKEIPKGVSMVMTFNKKSEGLVENAKKHLTCFNRTIDEVFENNQSGLKSSSMPKSRIAFYNDINNISFPEFINKYLKPSRKECFVKFFREYIPCGIVKFVRNLSQK